MTQARVATVLYVLFLAGAFTGCAAHLRVAGLRHRDEGHRDEGHREDGHREDGYRDDGA